MTSSCDTIGFVSIHPVHKSSFKQQVRLNNLYQSRILRNKKAHLVVFVHGYQGSKYDMRVLQNFMAKIIPHVVFLGSEANEEMDKKNIADMGKDLATEVSKFISSSNQHISKISFMGHSLGGIIIRAALEHLKHLRPYMFTYVSLSSPHLGCRKSKSMLVNLGMKYLNKFKKDLVITQLQMDDAPDMKDSYMYKLAVDDKLHWFKNIILVSSPQDSYVPYVSARIQLSKPKGKSRNNKIMYKMAKIIWEKIDNDVIVRLDIDIRSPQR